jgi:hypothetical protein
MISVLLQVYPSLAPREGFLIELGTGFYKKKKKKLWTLPLLIKKGQLRILVYTIGVQTPGARSAGRQNFVRWHLIFVFSLQNLVRVTLLVHTISRGLIDFWKNLWAPALNDDLYGYRLWNPKVFTTAKKSFEQKLGLVANKTETHFISYG